jgi:hypothetical protein
MDPQCYIAPGMKWKSLFLLFSRLKALDGGAWKARRNHLDRCQGDPTPEWQGRWSSEKNQKDGSQPKFGRSIAPAASAQGQVFRTDGIFGGLVLDSHNRSGHTYLVRPFFATEPSPLLIDNLTMRVVQAPHAAM